MRELADFRREIRQQAAHTGRKAAPYVAPYGTAFHRPQPRGTVDLLTTLKNWAGICINARAALFAAQEIKALTGEGREYTDKNLAGLFDNPNGKQTWYDIKNISSKWKDAKGNAFLYTPTNGGKLPLKIYPLRSTHVTLALNKSAAGGMVSHYEYVNDDGQTLYLPPNEVLHWCNYSPSLREAENWIIGLPEELIAATNGILNDEQRADFLAAFYAAGGTQFVLNNPDEFGAGDENTIGSFEFFKRQLNSVLAESHKVVAILDAGKTITPLPLAAGAQNIIGADPQKELTALICAAFKINVGYLTGEHQNRATAQIARQTAYELATLPAVTSFAAVLTQHFGQWFPGVKFRHERQSFVDENLLVQKLEYAHQSGIIDNEQWLKLSAITLPT